MVQIGQSDKYRQALFSRWMAEISFLNLKGHLPFSSIKPVSAVNTGKLALWNRSSVRCMKTWSGVQIYYTLLFGKKLAYEIELIRRSNYSLCPCHVYPCPCQCSYQCPCPCCMRIPMLHVHATCPCPGCMSVSWPHVHFHAECPYPCYMSMSRLYVHVHAGCPSPRWDYPCLEAACPCCMDSVEADSFTILVENTVAPLSHL
jgi:hypothetical protein